MTSSSCARAAAASSLAAAASSLARSSAALAAARLILHDPRHHVDAELLLCSTVFLLEEIPVVYVYNLKCLGLGDPNVTPFGVRCCSSIFIQ